MSFENMLRAFVRRTKTIDLGRHELEQIANNLLNEYNKERKILLEIKRGKGTLIIDYVGDTIITQKPQKDNEENIRWVTIKIKIAEVEKMYEIIKYLWKNKKEDHIKSTDCYEKFTGIPKSIFQSRRREHNKLNRILQILQKEGAIEYKKRGQIYLK